METQVGGRHGNAAALARWRAAQTPEELARRARLATKRRLEQMRARRARDGATDRVLAFGIQLREGGRYERGNSRTLAIHGCPLSLDDAFAWLEAQVWLLRDRDGKIDAAARSSKHLTW